MACKVFKLVSMTLSKLLMSISFFIGQSYNTKKTTKFIYIIRVVSLNVPCRAQKRSSSLI